MKHLKRMQISVSIHTQRPSKIQTAFKVLLCVCGWPLPCWTCFYNGKNTYLFHRSCEASYLPCAVRFLMKDSYIKLNAHTTKFWILHLFCILFREASNTTHQTKVEVKTQHCKSSSTQNELSNSNRKFLCEKGGSSNSIIKLLIPS